MASDLVPSAAHYIVDDQDPAIQYLCPIQQQHATVNGYFDKTWTSIEDNDCGNGWFMYSFNGKYLDCCAFELPANDLRTISQALVSVSSLQRLKAIQ
jgi:hypothetical protein